MIETGLSLGSNGVVCPVLVLTYSILLFTKSPRHHCNSYTNKKKKKGKQKIRPTPHFTASDLLLYYALNGDRAYVRLLPFAQCVSQVIHPHHCFCTPAPYLLTQICQTAKRDLFGSMKTRIFVQLGLCDCTLCTGEHCILFSHCVAAREVENTPRVFERRKMSGRLQRAWISVWWSRF